ncbi:hypothetical protein [Nonomuraea salmonea]|uniref:hypothetical protein n=1 Tax=Nonomuraea salmonea TaxID=46181 RepID=UPI002FE7C5D6
MDLAARERVERGTRRSGGRDAVEHGRQDVGRRAEIPELVGAVREQPGGVAVVELCDQFGALALIGERLRHVAGPLLDADAGG